jgi:hypothetical protein
MILTINMMAIAATVVLLPPAGAVLSASTGGEPMSAAHRTDIVKQMKRDKYQTTHFHGK